MIVEMLLLVLLAVAVFVYVLAPVMLHRDETMAANESIQESADDDAFESEPAVVEKQPVHDLS